MNGHLVAIEVGVVGVADQRVKLNGLAFHQDRLEGLDTKAVQRRSAVEKHRMLLDDLFETVPHRRVHAVDHLLGRLDVGRDLALDERLHHKRFEELEGHLLGQTALVQLQVRANHDDRAARVVHALTQQVLAETAFLALEHVAQRLERPRVRADDGPGAATVVDQGVHGFLQQPLFVVDDAFRRVDLDDLLQPVVAVDDASVKVVQVGCGEPAAVKLDHGPQFRADDRDRVHDHPLGAAARADERFDDFEPLDGPNTSLRGGPNDFVAQFASQRLEVHAVQEFLDGLGADVGAEQVAQAVLHPPTDGVQHFGHGSVLVLVDQLVALQLAEDFHGDVKVLQTVVGVAVFGLDSVVDGFGALADVALVPILAVVLQLLAERAEAFLLEFADVRHDELLLVFDCLADVRQELLDPLVVDVDDDEGGEVDDLLEEPRRDVEDQREGRGDALEVPDVADRRGQFDVAHALAADLAARDLDAAALARDAAVLDLLVATAGTFEVLDRSEDALAKETVPLGLERAVVDGFGFLDFSPRPAQDVFGAGDSNFELVEKTDVCHNRISAATAPCSLSGHGNSKEEFLGGNPRESPCYLPGVKSGQAPYGTHAKFAEPVATRRRIRRSAAR